MKNFTLSLIATMLLGFFNLLTAQQTSNPQSGNIKPSPLDRLSPPGDEFKKLQQQLFNENQLSQAAHQHKKGDGKSPHFRLTKDINDLASSSPLVLSSYVPNPNSQFPVAGNIAFFSAEDGVHGIELWRTDGTSAGTYIVKDINPGESSTAMLNMVAINGKIYFAASRDGFNYFPWVSDGTDSGTFAIDSTQQGRASFPQRFAGLNDAVYMSSSGSGLFDGSGFDFGGLAKINDDLHGFTFLNVLKNDGYSGVSELTEAGGLLFFTATKINSNRAVWRTDGTEEGTYKLTNLNRPDGSPTDGGVTSYLTAYNNKLYFLFADETGFKLGVSDGTITGTGLAPGNNGITIPLGNSNEYHFAVMNNVLFLSGNNQAGQNGLYKYDAANPNGLVLVKDIFPDVDNEIIYNSGFEVGNNVLYFLVSNPSTGIRQLWRSDGTEARTTPIRSLEPAEGISPFHFYLGNLYFVLHDALHGSEIWKSDGTANGTAIIKDINPGPDNSVSIPLTQCNGKVIFIANEIKTNTGIELWATNGTAPGTKLLKDINKTRTDGSNPLDGPPPATLKDELVFAATENVHGRELYISDGTEKGTRLLNDITSGKSGSSPAYFYAKNDEVYFVAFPNDFNHPTIYRTNGKPQGLKKIATYYKDVNDQTIFKVTDKGLVFFIVRNQVSHDNELWRSNGSLSGTFKIADKLATELIETVDNTVYFMAGNGTGTELWKSDGSVAGTKKFWSSPAVTYRMFSFRDRLYFVTVDANTTLWKTNGTTNGTVRLTDIPGAFSFQVSMISGETLYFVTFSPETFIEHLWKSNGTVAGTTELQGEFSIIYELGDVNGDLFFWGNSAEEPYSSKLWKISCRSSSIELIKDFSNNPVETFPGGSASAGDKYFFVVRGDLVPGTDFYNQILWSSDGTTAGTVAINDPLLSSLRFRSRLTGVDDKLFFAAESYQYGNELYVGRISRKHKDRDFEHENVAKPGDNILEKDASTNDKLKIFPNPTTNTITVFFQQQQVNDLIITINDQAGRVMIRKKLSTQKGANSVSFNVESLPAGTYIIQFSDRKERVTKFVKE